MVRIVIRFFEAPRMGLEPSKRSQHHSNRVTRRGEHTARTNGDFLVKSVASTARNSLDGFAAHVSDSRTRFRGNCRHAAQLPEVLIPKRRSGFSSSSKLVHPKRGSNRVHCNQFHPR